jgi:hypothetical protein
VCGEVLSVVLGLKERCGIFGGWEGGVLWYTWRVGSAVGERGGVTVRRVRGRRGERNVQAFRVDTHTHMRTCTHEHTCAHAHMHTCTHMHAHA